MNDLTDYSPAIRKLMADPDSRKEAIDTLFCKGEETINALITTMHHPHIGAMAITVMLISIFEDMVREDECSDVLSEE